MQYKNNILLFRKKFYKEFNIRINIIKNLINIRGGKEVRRDKNSLLNWNLNPLQNITI